MMYEYLKMIKSHYNEKWGNDIPTTKQWSIGPTYDLPEGFSVLEYPPSSNRHMWTYATCGMSQPTDAKCIELHLFSPKNDDILVELLTVVAHFHRTGSKLDLWHTVNFGKGWVDNSSCNHGLISLPYLDGPELELLEMADVKRTLHCYWLIPISESEVEYKKKNGIEALEKMFDLKGLNYLDIDRLPIV